ncbi:hypothetical protein EGN72_01025 [Pseudorhodobacter sp. E13]|uniref:O-linked N-acetylglucosamine transferase, SPINDLY family protein n=1 Tax=Pseudorhodobacter sp. E13 TaxID=2487931 RepID=UPI000F8E04D7|nr:tetratricopeptide repeat protein [Pseudorhodobacter sp. E13]RUS65194.1 hypothetical protein EGN72_01025 [Pseudorhodobacter sp. E13]
MIASTKIEAVQVSVDVARTCLEKLVKNGEADTALALARSLAISEAEPGFFSRTFYSLCWGISGGDVEIVLERLNPLARAYTTGNYELVNETCIAILRENTKVDQARLYLALSREKAGGLALAVTEAAKIDVNRLLSGRMLVALGELLFRGGEVDKARIAFRTAVRNETTSLTLANWAAMLLADGAKQQAYKTLQSAIHLDPKNELTLGNMSAACFDLGRLDEAEKYARELLTINPNNRSALINLANTLLARKKWSDAADLYSARLTLVPNCADTRTKLVYCLAQMADWTALGHQISYLCSHREQLEQAASAPNPWVLLSVVDDPELHQIAARRYAAKFNSIAPIPLHDRVPKSDKLNVGFFSADFYNHPTTQLILGLLKCLSREKFAVHAFSFSPKTSDGYMEKVSAAVDVFHEVSNLSVKDISELSRQNRIDVAIDLNGVTKNHRLGIFAYRAAPLQLQYLGYPGTTMCSQMDGLIADDIVIPKTSERHFSEKIFRLPGSYQINDRLFDAPVESVTRQEVGLPSEGQILACFNSVHKINSQTFDLWVSIMLQVPEAFLWLFSDEPIAKSNISERAKERGLDPDRILWANRVPRAQHLARHAHVSLCLDTFPYNAHTTASDALRMGVPIITYPGLSFASRVCASLLTELDMKELIAETTGDYVDKAVKLLLSPPKLKSLRKKLRERVDGATLFNPEAFAEGFQETLLHSWNLHLDKNSRNEKND